MAPGPSHWLLIVGCVSRRLGQTVGLAWLLIAPALRAQMTMRGPSPHSDPHKAYQGVGTKKMAALLERIYSESDWRGDPNKQAERAEYYKTMLRKPMSFADEFTVRRELGMEVLRAGDSAGAVAELEDLRNRARVQKQRLSVAAEKQLGQSLAIAYLRLGEQENCQQMHGQRSCIFPLRASAVHQLPRGAQGAVRELTALLDKDPEDHLSRWLLNVAYMQLGRYPQDVPKPWLIDEKLFRSEHEIAEFPEVAGSAGLDVLGHAGGVLMEDFDGDGLLDIMVTSSGPRDQMRLFHNNGDGTFRDVTAQSGLLGETGGLNLVVTDYNNDGHPDVLVLRGGWWGKYGRYPMSLLRNNGDGTFDDVTEQAGLMSMHPTQTAAWADYDGDGWLDVFVGHESTPGDPEPSQLFHNNGDGTFTEVGASMGLSEMGFVKGVAWGDYNNDGRPDLYISTMDGRNRLFRNDGPVPAGAIGSPAWRFADVTHAAGVDQQKHSFATWFFDYDNDGWPDIFVAGYSTHSLDDIGAFEEGIPVGAELPRLYRNNHDGTFTDVSHEVRIDRAIMTMGASFGDLDNDGWLDVYLGTGDSSLESLLPNRMFRNAEGKSFQDVTTAGGFGHLQKGHAVAFGDLEETGHEDVFEEMGGALPGDTYQSALYRNPGNANHWLTLELQGTKTNRAAFGARIHLTVRTQTGEREIWRTVGYGSSFGGNPLRQHIGIGEAVSVDRLEVLWPVSKTVQRFSNVAVDRSFHLREGDQRLAPMPVSGDRAR